MTECKPTVLLHRINFLFCYVFLMFFSVISMAFDRCSLRLLTYLLTLLYDGFSHLMQAIKPPDSSTTDNCIQVMQHINESLG